MAGITTAPTPIAPTAPNTYAPLAAGATPIPGTSGPSVAAMQTSLNSAYAGQSGYTPLVVDGKYGPLTQAAAAYKPPTVTAPPPTIASAYSIPGNTGASAINTAGAAADNFYQSEAAGGNTASDDTVRANTLQQFQAEIDATNAAYASQLAQAKITGQGRVGSTTAINAASGELGSDFGNANANNTTTANDAIYSGIQDQQNAAIQAILGKASDAATAAIAAKNTAMSNGLDAHLKYLQDTTTRNAANATTAAQSIYDQKLDPTKLTTAQLQQTADAYGITPQDITSAFVEVKKAGDAAAALAAATVQKDALAGEKVVPTGSTLVDSTGKVIATGTPKATAPLKLGSGQSAYKLNSDGTYTKVASVAPKAPATKAASTYKNFSSKPTAAAISKVNSYILAQGGNSAAIAAANGDEANFYKVYNAAVAAGKASAAGTSTYTP